MTLTQQYLEARSVMPRLCEPLAAEDTVVQSMPDVSPSKWHLAHVTWFFEQFILREFDDTYRPIDDRYHYLFNSYYYSAGTMHARPRRGLLSRPTLAEIYAYRAHVDDSMQSLIETSGDNADIRARVHLGINHEQQHQELFLTDIKHVLSCNPLLPGYDTRLRVDSDTAPGKLEFRPGPEGIQSVGADGDSFHFDNETPRHETLLREHRIGSRLVTNGEYRQFIDDGGYSDSNLWLSDGWAVINERGWNRPLYWSEDMDSEFTLGGSRDIDPDAPVTHVSYYEADAFARWAGARLPTEFEWEAAATTGTQGNLMESGYLHPVASDRDQFFGDVWEWTSSPYAAYPGFVPLEGSLGEYNGKFMCNQMTVRGGSCATAADHIRPSYRSFFYPDARWQFLGIRLAKDGR
jgi:ergothioneine biosynthesis protein EgtB